MSDWHCIEVIDQLEDLKLKFRLDLVFKKYTLFMPNLQKNHLKSILFYGSIVNPTPPKICDFFTEKALKLSFPIGSFWESKDKSTLL